METSRINNGVRSTLLFRSGGLYGSQLIGMSLAFLCNLVAARLLGPQQFGQFAFIQAVVMYVGLFFDGGTSIATGRLLALSHDASEQRTLIGAWLTVFSVIGIAYSAALFFGSMWVEQFFQFEVGSALALCAIPAIGIPIQNALREVFQGLGATVHLSLLNTCPWAGFLLGLAGVWLIGNPSVLHVTFAFTGSILVTVAVLLFSIKPKVWGTKVYISRILAETQGFGFHAYLGRLVGTGTYQLDSPLIAFFTKDPVAVGFYALAKGLVAPISLLTRSIGVVSYRRFAASARLPQGLVWWSALGLVAACSTVYVLGGPVVLWFFSDNYAGVLPLLYVWAVVALIQGAYQLPNIFLSAKGQGKILLTMAFWFGLANVALNFSLIPLMGALGASLASGGASLLWLYMSVFYYRRVVGEIAQSSNTDQSYELQAQSRTSS